MDHLHLAEDEDAATSCVLQDGEPLPGPHALNVDLPLEPES